MSPQILPPLAPTVSTILPALHAKRKLTCCGEVHKIADYITIQMVTQNDENQWKVTRKNSLSVNLVLNLSPSSTNPSVKSSKMLPVTALCIPLSSETLLSVLILFRRIALRVSPMGSRLQSQVNDQSQKQKDKCRD